MTEGSWTTRLRWRMRGATEWPAFAAALIAVAVLLQALPIAGDGGPGVFPAVLLSGFFCLVVVAVAAPLAAVWLRRRRPDLPRVVAVDKAATVLLVALVGLVALLGVLHRPAVKAAGADLSAQTAQVRRFVLAHAPARFRANVDRLDVWKQGPGLYRTCVPGPDPRRSFCVIVDTARRPLGITRDPDQRPNATVAGPGNPGRGPG
ncbi:MAG: hypothetical protein ACXVFN_21370 [Solirubrobacteraceae bacterium]